MHLANICTDFLIPKFVGAGLAAAPGKPSSDALATDELATLAGTAPVSPVVDEELHRLARARGQCRQLLASCGCLQQ